MDTELRDRLREKWIAALESGEYEQCEGVLTERGDSFCCLGVATEVYLEEVPDTEVVRFIRGNEDGREAEDGQEYDSYAVYDGDWIWEEGGLLDEVRDAFGLRSEVGRIDDDSLSLAEENDAGANFKHIAGILRTGKAWA